MTSATSGSDGPDDDDPFAVDPEVLDGWCAHLDELTPHDQAAWIATEFAERPQIAAFLTRYACLAEPDVDGGAMDPSQRAEEIRARFPAGTVVLARFEIVRTIGIGGSGGTVFLAEDVVDRQPAAIKILKPHADEQRRLAYQEAVLLRDLDLPGVVTYMAEGDVDGHVVIAMRYIDGTPFGAACAALSPALQLRILQALLETLGRIHASGYLHNDLKPPNVIVAAEDGLPVVLDLGVSSALDPDAPHGIRHGGTPAYMSPERMRGEGGTIQSDLFAVALMAWETLAGRPLGYAEGEPRDAVIRARLAWSTDDVEQALEAVPEDLHPFFRACLDPEPEQRPASTYEASALLPGNTRLTLHALLDDLPDDEPLDLEALRSLFVGIEAGLEMRTRAALLVQAAVDQEGTLPTPRTVQALLDAWERARLGYWDRDGFHLDLGTLHRLEREYPTGAPSIQGPVVLRADDPRHAWLDLLRIARGRVSDSLLARILGVDPDHFSAEVARLDLRREAERQRPITSDERVALARSIADELPIENPRRLEFLLEAQAHDELIDALDASLDMLLERGWVGDAARLASDVLRRLPVSAHTLRLLAIALLVGCRARDDQLTGDVRARIERAPLTRDERDDLRRIAQAARRTRYTEARTHYDELSGGGTRDDAPRLQQALACVKAALLCKMPVEDARPHLASHRRVPAESLDARLALVLAVHCAQEGAVDEAAERFQELSRRSLPIDMALEVAIEGGRNEFQRMATGRIEAYIQLLRREMRDSRGDWIRLHVLYLARRLVAATEREVMPPEPELARAADLIGDRALAVDFALLESGAAWHQGDTSAALDIVESALLVAPSATEVAGVALLMAFARFLGVGSEERATDAFNQLMERGAYPAIQLQAAAFLVEAGANISRPYRGLLGLALQRIPGPQRGYRRELLSLEQARAWLGL